jgi:hypothetical protein
MRACGIDELVCDGAEACTLLRYSRQDIEQIAS